MAHFAELKTKVDPTGFTTDTHQVVERVVVVGNDIAANGGILADNDMHQDGETWCINFFKGGIWKQTSYNHNFRKQYAGIGMIYDPVKDKFLSQQPHASWSLDSNDDWQAPVPYPTIKTYDVDGNDMPYSIFWDEEDQIWKALDHNTPTNTFEWNSETLTWGAPAV